MYHEQLPESFPDVAQSDLQAVEDALELDRVERVDTTGGVNIVTLYFGVLDDRVASDTEQLIQQAVGDAVTIESIRNYREDLLIKLKY